MKSLVVLPRNNFERDGCPSTVCVNSGYLVDFVKVDVKLFAGKSYSRGSIWRSFIYPVSSVVHELEVNSDGPFSWDRIDHAGMLLAEFDVGARNGAWWWHQSGISSLIFGH